MGKTTLGLVAVVVLAVVIAAIIGSLLFINNSGEGEPRLQSREVAALVNGASIYFDDVNEEYLTLAPEQEAATTKADALSFIIEREILYQEAVKTGLKATKEELQLQYQEFLSATNITEAGLEEQLAGRNSTLERFKAMLNKQLLINKLLDKKVPSRFIIKNDDIEAFYNASGFASRGIAFEQAEQAIVELLTAQRQKTARESYIERLKENADVIVVAVPP
ncbi:SurA N-terminal domain-containing protein [Candidatus Woesearchaeota archaeon]|nr:SurA N-terminal domain-containing protein [Candidatus Woesearchaeota archaeon]